MKKKAIPVAGQTNWRDNSGMATLPIYDDPQSKFVSVREYLSTSYRPDCEYVDGRIEERNVGEFEHGYLQALLAQLFLNNSKAWGVRAVTDVRIQVKPANFRIPDVSVLRLGSPKERVLTHPPLLVIEILSPEDRLGRVQERIDEYLDFGIENIWIIDPEHRKVQLATRMGLHIADPNELIVPETPIQVVLSELFAELDRA
jgi:Uma2 family endonuclease